ncbi:hypothetical protein [Phaeospirillum tilakii]|uniref:Uncharacterized protein n=1 Tax=Phaeospirillum tilakii TaxID=741673 RepID=A0ABW5C7U1_9PROT
MSSATGHYRMHRGWMDNPALGGARESFCRRAAWCWLIENAAWKPRRESIAGRTVELQRGQVTASLRFMAKAWGWSEPAVRRFIERLKTDAMIDAATDAGQMVITICNYDKYQAEAGNTDAATDAPSDAEATQERRKEERKKEGNLGGGGDARSREDADPVTEPDASTGIDPFQPDARTVVSRFHHLRRTLWPTEAKFPAPDLTLLTQAAEYLQGAPLALVLDVIEHGMRTAAADGRPATQSLKAFCLSIPNAAVSHRKSLGGAHGTDQPRPRSARRRPYDPDESRRRTLEAFPDLVDGPL